MVKKNIADKFNPLRRVHQRNRQTDTMDEIAMSIAERVTYYIRRPTVMFG